MTSLLSAEGDTEDDDEDDGDDYSNNNRSVFDLPPEHLTFQALRVFLKLPGGVLHLVGLFFQVVELVLVGYQLVDVILHSSLQVVDVGLGLAELVEVLRPVEFVQQTNSLVFQLLEVVDHQKSFVVLVGFLLSKH